MIFIFEQCIWKADSSLILRLLELLNVSLLKDL